MIRQRFKIQEIAKDFGDAPFGSNLKSKDYTKSGIPVIQGGNIVEQKFEWNNKLYVSKEKFNSLKRSHCRAGDLVFPKIGNRTVSSCTIVPAVEGHKVFLLSTNMMKVSVKPEIANLQYVYYYFCQKHIRQYIVSIAGGGAQPIFNLTTLKNFEIELPPVPIQNKVAALLSAYDDLIENNTRRIEILEEMARSLYQEWFVSFRFPGHEQVKMVDSELGLIPEGWEVKPIGEIINTVGGGTPSTTKPEYWDGGDIIWYAPKNLTAADTMFITESEKKITALGLQKSSARMFPAYSVMMTSRATIGVVAINTKPACTNQGFITCIPNDQLSAYQIYFWIKESLEKISNLASGATFKEINKATFRNLPMVIAELDIRKNFVEILSPICKEVENLQTKNTNLRQTRDLLLPKLISGEIDLEEINIEVYNAENN